MNIQRRIYVIAEMLLCFMLNIILITVVFLLCGIKINTINFIVPIIIMLFYRYKLFFERKKYLWLDFAVCVIILLFFILLSGNVFDQTCDGAAYHKTAVGLLKEGWNPFYMSASEYNSITHSIHPERYNPLLWAETYPKATWYFAANLYYLTNCIESGKCYTLIFAFITFGVCIEYFRKKQLHNVWIVILSAVTSLNPIVCAQLQTYYLDGVVAEVLTMFFIKLLDLLNDTCEERKEKCISVFALMVWGCNLKFNIALYISTICAIYCICISIKAKKLQLRNTFILTMEGVIALFFVGCNPYITNIYRYGNMFHGFEGLLNEQEFQRTFGIQGLNNIERFWTSVFGRTSHGQYASMKEILKIPFTFWGEELHYYDIPDVRVGGFGIMFSGLFLVSFIILGIVLVRGILRKKSETAFLFTFLSLGVSLLEFCFVPQTSQFRYIPHFYLCVVFALYYLIVNGKQNIIRVGTVAYVILIGINLWPWFGTIVAQIDKGQEISAVLQSMGQVCENEGYEYEISFFCDDYTGIHYNLKDNKIKYKYIDFLNADKETCSITFSGWLYYK